MKVNKVLEASAITARVLRNNANVRDLDNLLWMILDKGMDYDVEQEVREMLVKAREEAGLSRRQVETRVGVPYANLSEFENGNRTPRLQVLQKIAHAYGKRLVVRFEDEEGAPVPLRKPPKTYTKEEVLEIARKAIAQARVDMATEIAEEIAERRAEDTAEETAEETAEAKASADKRKAKPAAKPIAKRMAEQSAKQTAEQIAKQTAEQIAKQTAQPTSAKKMPRYVAERTKKWDA